MRFNINFSAVFREGGVAAIDGKPSSANPYKILTPKWWAWVDGFNHFNAVKRRAAAPAHRLIVQLPRSEANGN